MMSQYDGAILKESNPENYKVTCGLGWSTLKRKPLVIFHQLISSSGSFKFSHSCRLHRLQNPRSFTDFLNWDRPCRNLCFILPRLRGKARIFLVLTLFNLQSSTIDHSATASPQTIMKFLLKNLEGSSLELNSKLKMKELGRANKFFPQNKNVPLGSHDTGKLGTIWRLKCYGVVFPMNSNCC